MKKIFTLLSVVALGISANAQNLLTNPGFENDLTGWSAGTGSGYTLPTVITTSPYAGTKAVEYAGVTATTGFYQNIPVTEGKTYVISFWYKASGDGTDGRLWSVYKNSTGGTVYTTANADTDQFRTNNGYLPTSTVWKNHVAEMPAGTGAVSLDVALRAYGGSTSVQYDDISVQDKSTMSTIDIKEFDKKVKMNTLVSDNLTLIELPSKSTVNIYSVDGKLVSSNRVNSGESINVSKLQKGNYIVTVEDGTNKVSRKIVKK